MNLAEEKTFYTVHKAIQDISKVENFFLDNAIFYQGAWFIVILFFVLQRSASLSEKETEKWPEDKE